MGQQDLHCLGPAIPYYLDSKQLHLTIFYTFPPEHKIQMLHMPPGTRLTDGIISGLCQQSRKLSNAAKHRVLVGWKCSRGAGRKSPGKQPCFLLLPSASYN